MRTIYVGHDAREEDAYKVCELSLKKHSSSPINIVPLRDDTLRRAGLYDRPFTVDGAQRYDDRDKKPFSTDFSFTRFLVPTLQLWRGWALFCDCDFLWRTDVQKLFNLCDDKYAVMVAKCDYRPPEQIKMDGQKQEPYPRKNWSSMVLWNCSHPANEKLTPKAVNFMTGSYLHGFKWLKDEHIGSVPESWNWLEGHSSSAWEPHAVHYTRGVPSMPGYENVPYANEWRGYLNDDHDERAA